MPLHFAFYGGQVSNWFEVLLALLLHASCIYCQYQFISESTSLSVCSALSGHISDSSR